MRAMCCFVFTKANLESFCKHTTHARIGTKANRSKSFTSIANLLEEKVSGQIFEILFHKMRNFEILKNFMPN
jgi:hypothetical protein